MPKLVYVVKCRTRIFAAVVGTRTRLNAGRDYVCNLCLKLYKTEMLAPCGCSRCEQYKT
jgi:hypothetical protein